MSIVTADGLLVLPVIGMEKLNVLPAMEQVVLGYAFGAVEMATVVAKEPMKIQWVTMMNVEVVMDTDGFLARLVMVLVRLTALAATERVQ